MSNSYKWCVIYSIVYLLAIVFFGCTSKSTSQKGMSSVDPQVTTDTISGYFLYEGNVPLNCYTRNGQTEQGPNLIYFDTAYKSKNIDELYERGVFLFERMSIVTKEMDLQYALQSDKESLWKFTEAISYMHNKHDSSYIRSLHFDSRNILSFKLVFAEFVVKKLGAVEQLVPYLENFTCCYSNIRKSVLTYFIEKVIRFKIY